MCYVTGAWHISKVHSCITTVHMYVLKLPIHSANLDFIKIHIAILDIDVYGMYICMCVLGSLSQRD